MKLLCFVADSFDVSAFGQSDLADNFLIFFLIWSQVIMRNMSRSFETIRKWHSLTPFFHILKNIENFLIRQIIKPKLNLTFN